MGADGSAVPRRPELQLELGPVCPRIRTEVRRRHFHEWKHGRVYNGSCAIGERQQWTEYVRRMEERKDKKPKKLRAKKKLGRSCIQNALATRGRISENL